MLGSFPDLADVIEIVLESKAQHEETWEGQVDLTVLLCTIISAQHITFILVQITIILVHITIILVQITFILVHITTS